MFTGIIQDLGQVEKIEKKDDMSFFTISSRLSSGFVEGASIAINGACHTVLSYTDT